MRQYWLAATIPLAATPPALAWEPTKAIEIVVPFSSGDASDQMARTVQGVIQKNQFTTQPIIIVADGLASLRARNAQAKPVETVK